MRTSLKRAPPLTVLSGGAVTGASDGRNTLAASRSAAPRPSVYDRIQPRTSVFECDSRWSGRRHHGASSPVGRSTVSYDSTTRWRGVIGAGQCLLAIASPAPQYAKSKPKKPAVPNVAMRGSTSSR